MTKEEYEKQQSVIRRVFDPDTGRHRCVLMAASRRVYSYCDYGHVPPAEHTSDVNAVHYVVQVGQRRWGDRGRDSEQRQAESYQQGLK